MDVPSIHRCTASHNHSHKLFDSLNPLNKRVVGVVVVGLVGVAVVVVVDMLGRTAARTLLILRSDR